MSSELVLTSEQKQILAKEMGLVCDKLLLSISSDEEQDVKLSDLGENIMLAIGHTMTIS